MHYRNSKDFPQLLIESEKLYSLWTNHSYDTAGKSCFAFKNTFQNFHNFEASCFLQALSHLTYFPLAWNHPMILPLYQITYFIFTWITSHTFLDITSCEKQWMLFPSIFLPHPKLSYFFHMHPLLLVLPVF